MIRVDRCICAGRTFASLHDEAKATGLPVTVVADRCGAGEGCRTCLPYLKRAERTGQVVFHELLSPDDTSEHSAA